MRVRDRGGVELGPSGLVRQRTRDLERQLAEEEQQRAALEQQRAALEQQLAEAERQREALEDLVRRYQDQQGIPDADQ